MKTINFPGGSSQSTLYERKDKQTAGGKQLPPTTHAIKPNTTNSILLLTMSKTRVGQSEWFPKGSSEFPRGSSESTLYEQRDIHTAGGKQLPPTHATRPTTTTNSILLFTMSKSRT